MIFIKIDLTCINIFSHKMLICSLFCYNFVSPINFFILLIYASGNVMLQPVFSSLELVEPYMLKMFFYHLCWMNVHNDLTARTEIGAGLNIDSTFNLLCQKDLPNYLFWWLNRPYSLNVSIHIKISEWLLKKVWAKVQWILILNLDATFIKCVLRKDQWSLP